MDDENMSGTGCMDRFDAVLMTFNGRDSFKTSLPETGPALFIQDSTANRRCSTAPCVLASIFGWLICHFE